MQSKLCVVGILAGMLLAGCEQRDTGAELDAMRTDLQRLENEIGRLEFRIYELENPGGSPDQAAEPLGESAATGVAPADPEVADPLPAGRFDLRPVE